MAKTESYVDVDRDAAAAAADDVDRDTPPTNLKKLAYLFCCKHDRTVTPPKRRVRRTSTACAQHKSAGAQMRPTHNAATKTQPWSRYVQREKSAMIIPFRLTKCLIGQSWGEGTSTTSRLGMTLIASKNTLAGHTSDPHSPLIHPVRHEPPQWTVPAESRT